MTRRRNPPTPSGPPRARPVRKPSASVEDVLALLDDLPTVRGAQERIRAYLQDKRDQHPEWWASQSPEQLARLGQVFGVMHGT